MLLYTLVVLSILFHHGTSRIHQDPLEHEHFQLKSNRTDPQYRLPPIAAKDLKYKLFIQPFFDTGDEKQFTFNGQLDLHFRVEIKNVKNLTMHSSGLKIQTANLFILPGNLTESRKPILHDTVTAVFDPEVEKYEFVTFKWNRPIQPDTAYNLKVTYSGKFNKKMQGFYLSTFQENGTLRYLASTQMEPTHARKVFPCFDEPRYKGTFQVSIECPTSYECMSNTVVDSRTNNLIAFDETPLMSTYLVALLVSNFERINAYKTSKLEFELVARPEARTMGEYTFNVGIEMLAVMGDYTKINFYTMDGKLMVMKMTNAAIPDFKAGAMENWGQLTYRESALLIDNKRSPSESKIGAAKILAHEQAHQWFGNMVTCDWWSNAWLNEGFASFFEFKIPAIVRPELDTDDLFIQQKVQVALVIDASENSTSLYNEVNSPSEIKINFSPIGYAKGSSIIRMMENYIGEETFRMGLQYYLKDRGYRTALPKDLFKNLQKAVTENNVDTLGFTIKEIMDTWVYQPGFPLITVTKKPESGMLILTQKRFIARSLNNSTKVPADNIYSIPISYTTETDADFEDTRPKFIFSNRTMELYGDISFGWTILNLKQTSFYRVLYDESLYKQIAETLEGDGMKKIHYINRGHIVDDIFNFIKEGVMKAATGLNIIKFLRQELNSHVWDVAQDGFKMLKKRFMHNKNVTVLLNKHILNLMYNTLKDVTLAACPTDFLKRRVYRSRILNFACEIGHQNCLLKAKELFQKNDSEIDPDLRQIACCSGLKYGSEEDYDKLWNMFLNENVVNVKNIMMNSLACSRNQKKIKSLLNELFKNDSAIREQDVVSLMTRIINQNLENTETALVFVKNNIIKMKKRLRSYELKGVFNTLAMHLSSEQLNDFKSFANTEANGLTKSEVNSILNSIEKAYRIIQYADEEAPPLIFWLKNLH